VQGSERAELEQLWRENTDLIMRPSW